MDSLHMLAGQVERRRQLLVLLDSIQRQRQELKNKNSQLKAQWQKEQLDVDRLEQGSLVALLYEMLGKKEERLEKEQREALAAAAKYRSAQAELEDVERRQACLHSELQELQGCEERYEAAKRARAAELKAENGQMGQRILTLETKLGTLESQQREIQEALAAGTLAEDVARQMQSELDSAEDWGIYDIWGGGLIAQIAKHDHLDQAQSLVERLQTNLRQFKTELDDVEIHADLNLRVDDFLRFADWFFDGWIVDLTVQGKIEDAQDQVYGVQEQIGQCMGRLERMQADVDRQMREIKETLEQLLLQE